MVASVDLSRGHRVTFLTAALVDIMVNCTHVGGCYWLCIEMSKYKITMAKPEEEY